MINTRVRWIVAHLRAEVVCPANEMVGKSMDDMLVEQYTSKTETGAKL